MLTKDLLKFNQRQGKLFPQFIEERRPALVKLADDLTQTFRQSVGKTLTEIETLGDTVETREASADGLRKLLMDRCQFAEIDERVMSDRWELFYTAQDLRDEGGWGDPADYSRLMAERGGDDITVLRQKLFSDHPDERRCEAFEDISGEELLREYNRAQLQTLFIFADDVKITFKAASLVEKRAFFRQLKFHGLMSEVAVDPEDATTTVFLSGPLKLFHKSTTYGLRLARFILNVLHLKTWELEATIQLKNKRLSLKLDSGCGVRPRGRGLTGYVPEEFSAVMKVFNESEAEWQMQPSEDFVLIGKQSYCFPDFDLIKGKTRVHVELFHGWHKGQVVSRLNALKGAKVKNLRVGVDKALLKDKEIQAALSGNSWFESYGFNFSQFPTPRQLLKAVEA